MHDYWISRYSETIDKAIEASNENSRLAYLKLAKHYLAVRAKVGHPATAAYRAHI
jgi:hypothetical protein